MSMIRTKSSLYTLGSNSNCGLGIRGTQRNYHDALELVNIHCKMPSVAMISVADEHGLAATPDGSLYCWGIQHNFQCGAEHDGRMTITKSKHFRNVKFKQISASYTHSIVLMETGTIYGFGKNTHKEAVPSVLFDHVVKPIEIEFFKSLRAEQAYALNEKTVVVVLDGASTRYVLLAFTTHSHVLYAFGNNEHNQLALNNSFVTVASIPTKMIFANPNHTIGLKVRHVDGSLKHTVILDDRGNIFGAGYSADCQFLSITTFNSLTLLNISAYILEKVVSVSIKDGHAFAITESGVLYAWGANKNGALGLGFVSAMVCSPQRVPVSFRTAFISSSNQARLISDTEGNLYDMGRMMTVRTS